ncbi:hypothetical protein SMAC4_12943 [Sordaria macrospora]|uniref:uncharacterized protein n=1 Tax=Sordaria macrospora TaxID=5147 RepID=UPI001E0268D4|nr:hypothetical protein B0T09DRAFT_336688 [Sordaria sp. MPI-SDFR-AT-0083]WPJ63263.1 hypothetical protein SMAC4_12943 [Sordaria macrospora]
MCISETDSHKQKKMTSESPRYLPIPTAPAPHGPSSSSYRSNNSYLSSGGRTRGVTDPDGLLHGAHELLHNTQELTHRVRELNIGGGSDGNYTHRHPRTSTARQDYGHRRDDRRDGRDTNHGRIDDYHYLGRDRRDRREDRDDGYTPRASTITLAPASTSRGTGTHGHHLAPPSTSRGHPGSRNRGPNREPQERVTTYVQDNVIMRISRGAAQHAHGHGHQSGGGGGGGGGRNREAVDDDRRKYYRDRMAKIIQELEPELPPPASGRGSGMGRGAPAGGGGGSGSGGAGSSGGAGGFVYSGMGMGSGAGAAPGYGNTNGTHGTNGTHHGNTSHDSGYGSFSGSPASYGRGHYHT